MRTLQVAALASIVLAVSTPAAGQSPGYAIVPARIDAVFKDYGPTTPGCALGVYDKGRVVYSKGYGMADLTLGVPITPRTVFDIGSTSKQFAAAAIVLLANEGKLSLTDDVRKHVPELPSYGKVITIDHMLRHTSGLRDYNGLLYLGGHFFEDYTNDDDALSIITSQRNLNFEPGAKWDYSNSGFFLLSVIVKRVTGKTLAEFSKERFFAPLGMPITHFRDDHTAILKDRATAYSPAAKGFAIDMSNWDQTGDGAINTNVLELARWDANFYDAKVGGRALIDRLQERGALDNGDSIQYARGLFVDTYRGVRRVHHGGAWAGYRAMLMRFPEQGVAIGLACNVGNADTQGRSERVADVVLARAFKEPPKGFVSKASVDSAAARKHPSVDVSHYAGTFYSEAEQSAITVTVDSGRASVQAMGRRFPLTIASPDELVAMGGMISVAFSPSRDALTLAIQGRKGASHARIARVTPTAADLAELAGSYRSPEIGTTWTVRADSGTLVMEGRAVGKTVLEPVIKDRFSSATGFVAFTRGADGRINGFEVSASRMQRIRFDR